MGNFQPASTTWDDSKTSLAEIFQAINDRGYACAPTPSPESRRAKLKTALMVSLGLPGIAALIVVGALLTQGRPHIPHFDQGVSYGLLFITGLLTGFHCIKNRAPNLYERYTWGARNMDMAMATAISATWI